MNDKTAEKIPQIYSKGGTYSWCGLWDSKLPTKLHYGLTHMDVKCSQSVFWWIVDRIVLWKWAGTNWSGWQWIDGSFTGGSSHVLLQRVGERQSLHLHHQLTGDNILNTTPWCFLKQYLFTERLGLCLKWDSQTITGLNQWTNSSVNQSVRPLNESTPLVYTDFSLENDFWTGLNQNPTVQQA